MVEGQVSQEDLELQEQNLFDNARFSVRRGYFAVRRGMSRKTSTERFNCLHSMKGKV